MLTRYRWWLVQKLLAYIFDIFHANERTCDYKVKIASNAVFEGYNLKYFWCCLVFNSEIHQKVFIYGYLQFKSGYKENYLALTSLKIPLTFTHVVFQSNSLRTCGSWSYSTSNNLQTWMRNSVCLNSLMSCQRYTDLIMRNSNAP